ncbi:DUF3592 domain-containing protein [Lysobacter terrae]
MKTYKNDPVEAAAKAVIFAAAGVLILIVGAAWCLSVKRFVDRAETADGIVTGLPYGGSHPEVTFTTKDGQVIEAAQNGMIGGYHIGDRVQVFYDAKSPRDCTLKTFGALWGFPIGVLVMGAIFIVFAVSATDQEPAQ